MQNMKRDFSQLIYVLVNQLLSVLLLVTRQQKFGITTPHPLFPIVRQRKYRSYVHPYFRLSERAGSMFV